MKLKIKKQQQSTLSEWIGCGLTGSCDDVLTSTGEPTRALSRWQNNKHHVSGITHDDMHNNQQKH